MGGSKGATAMGDPIGMVSTVDRVDFPTAEPFTDWESIVCLATIWTQSHQWLTLRNQNLPGQSFLVRALMHARTQKTTAHWSFTQEPYELKLEKAWASCHELVPLVPHPPLGTLQ